MKWYWSKYPAWVKVLVIIGVVIGIGMALSDAFKGSQKVDSSSRAEESVSNKAEANTLTASSVLKIKGFYLGMNIDDAADLLNKKYTHIISKPASVEQLKDGAFRITIGAKVEMYGVDEELEIDEEMLEAESGEINAGSDKKVNLIIFKEGIVDPLFNSKDMSLETFVQEFSKAYGISYFEPFSDEEFNMLMGTVYEQGYKYSDNQGNYIQISSKFYFVKSIRTVLSSKILLIKAIPKSDERGFD